MTKYLLASVILFTVLSGLIFADEATIRNILTFPKSYEGRLLELSGTVSNVKPLTPAGYYFFELSDENGNAIRVRSSHRGRMDGQACSLKGRLRADPLQGGYFIVEEEVLLNIKANSGAQLPPPAPPVSPPAPSEPVDEPSTPLSSDTEAIDVSEPEPAEPPSPPTPAIAPALTGALSGEYGQLFETASVGLKDLFISEVGRLVVSVLHPTCTFSSNLLESNYRLGSAGRAQFRTDYNGLLIGDREMHWEVVFDNNGMLSDVRLISDSSPLTNVALINTVKDRVAGLIRSYIEKMLQTINR